LASQTLASCEAEFDSEPTVRIELTTYSFIDTSTSQALSSESIESA